MSAGLAFLAGWLAGSRTVTPPTVVSWAARAGQLELEGTGLARLGSPAAAAGLALLAVGELVGDKLPGLGSRTSAGQFAGRVASGALCGAAIGLPRNAVGGMSAGVAGAVLGTLVSAGARSALARRLGMDLPAAMVEDAAVLAGAALLMQGLSRRAR